MSSETGGKDSSFAKDTKEHEESGYLTKTSNGAGWQINALDEYGEIFVEYAKTCSRPIADLGVAYGFTSKSLLDAGAKVIANDLSKDMLHELEKSVSKEQKERLTLMPGDALKLKIDKESLDGIWANRYLHFLKPDDIRASMKHFYSWLAPGGKLCITAATPFFGSVADFLPKYQKRKEAGEEWPGYMAKDEVPEDWKEASDALECGHVLDMDVLQREVKRVGFTVEQCSYIARPYAGSNGKEGVGIIAVKPQS